MPRLSRTYSDYIYGAFAEMTRNVTTYAASGTVDVEPKTVYLIGNATTFITDGVAVGDTVTMDVGLETATVVSVDSNTALYTTALSGSGTYDSAEAFTITKPSGTTISTGAVAATNPETIVCIDSTATWLTDGVMAGDTVTMTVGGETATVSTVHSDTRLTTTALSAAGTYDAAEAFTIADGTILRTTVYTGALKQHYIRKLIGVSDDVTGSISVFRGRNTTTPVFSIPFSVSPTFDFNPDLKLSDEGVAYIVEVDIATEAGSALNVSWESS